MGGSGGGDPVSPGIGQSEPSDEDTCRSLRFTTNLEPELSGPIHEMGAILTVVPTEVGAGTVFVAVDNDQQPVGTIIEETDSLLYCTALGVSFEAQVREVNDGTYNVLVRASSARRA